ncbi:hypothetical protein D9619_004778 [Psilocybe cf. subviscida]|uniref:SPT2 chromatin protein n=1 Tax=Psilocybe cf. subviscida TaxID=2480587 RepID=A0A8H5F8W4_9AGAR|nr:hypothetical protein D9619_004778 [Psilocybe cf. subviscida]
MTPFASLMALSKSQTQQAQAAVENQLAERKRKQAEQRRQQEEREQREREQEKKLRLKKLQEDQRQRERLEKLEAERKAREAALQRREDEQRDALRYGPKKIKSGPAGASGSKQGSSSSDATRGRRQGDDSDLEGGGGGALTREEIRQRKLQQEQRKIYQMSKRSSTSTARAYSKAGLRLPGGAVNIVTNKGGHAAGEQQSPATGRGTKERLAALPNTLVKLNTQKRDKRTEDEIQMQVRAKRQVLEGADAAAFDDWFGDKKKEKPKSPLRPAVPASSPPSRPITPAIRPSASGAISASASTSQRHDARAQKPFLSKPTVTTNTQKASGSTSRGGSFDAYPSTSKYPKMTKTSSASSAPPSRPAPRPPATYPSTQPARKRPRSPSYDESPSPPPPPSKKRASAHHRDDLEDPNDVRDMIWKMFGKKRETYTEMDVYSDDEDMEADAYSLEHEEAKSAHIAKMEDLRAQEEERRHEEEKRRRKKERERAAARGH